MKFKFNIEIMLIAILLFSLIAVMTLFKNPSDVQAFDKSSTIFRIVSYDRMGRYYTMYDRETKVIYVMKNDFITMLVDVNGKPKLYKDELENN